jgi:hypothetical protein
VENTDAVPIYSSGLQWQTDGMFFLQEEKTTRRPMTALNFA